MSNRTIKEMIALSVRKSGMSKEDIVQNMNKIAGRYGVSLRSDGNGGELSEATFEKWVNPSDNSHPIPAHALPLLCKVVNDTSVLSAMLKPFGLSIIGPDAAKKLAWAETKLNIIRQNRLMKKLESEL
jgi:hypothetical protein